MVLITTEDTDKKYTVNGEKLDVFVNESNQSRNRKVALVVATFRSRL